MIAPFMTWSGRAVDLAAPRPDDVELRAIAHHLHKVCRFGGALGRHYSVLSHSLLVHALVRTNSPDAPPEFARWALLHDAAEAYLGDVTSPLKRLLGDRYHELETLWQHAICSALRVPRVDVHYEDLQAMLSERHAFACERSLAAMPDAEFLGRPRGSFVPAPVPEMAVMFADATPDDFLQSCYEEGIGL